MFANYLGLSCILIVCVVRSVDSEASKCKNEYVDMENVPIQTSQYCSNKNCIIKCCRKGEAFDQNVRCDSVKKFRVLAPQMKYSNISLTKSLMGSKEIKSNKNLEEHFIFINNKKLYCNPNSALEISDFYILEDGSAKLQFDELETLKPLQYCVDFRVFLTFNNTKVIKRQALFILMAFNTEEDPFGEYMIAIGMLTSCFFLLLVLIVYGLLPSLRNLPGLLFMAYISSLFVTYLLRAVLTLIIKMILDTTCKKLTPALYFAALSKFFWLNVMSYDLWSEIGKPRNRNSNRREEYTKVAYYGLYAWGVPALMTIAATIIDNFDQIFSGHTWSLGVQPQFKECFRENKGLFYYLHIPIAIIITVNAILFFWTSYKIWKVKRACRNTADSRKSQKDVNMTLMHMKLVIMAGLSWFIELLPLGDDSSSDTTWLFYVLNFYHVFIGVIIFFLFVFKQHILIKLCKRFGIFNDYVQKVQASHMYSLAESSRDMSKSSKKGSWLRKK